MFMIMIVKIALCCTVFE